MSALKIEPNNKNIIILVGKSSEQMAHLTGMLIFWINMLQNLAINPLGSGLLLTTEKGGFQNLDLSNFYPDTVTKSLECGFWDHDCITDNKNVKFLPNLYDQSNYFSDDIG